MQIIGACNCTFTGQSEVTIISVNILAKRCMHVCFFLNFMSVILQCLLLIFSENNTLIIFVLYPVPPFFFALFPTPFKCLYSLLFLPHLLFAHIWCLTFESVISESEAICSMFFQIEHTGKYLAANMEPETCTQAGLL